MNDINSRAGSAIDLKLSNTQTFNRWRRKRKKKEEKKEGDCAWARGHFKVKVTYLCIYLPKLYFKLVHGWIGDFGYLFSCKPYAWVCFPVPVWERHLSSYSASVSSAISLNSCDSHWVMWPCQLQSQTSKTQQRQDSSRPPEVTRTERGGGGGRGVVWGAMGERKSDEKGCGQQKGGGRIADELETEGSLSSPARAERKTLGQETAWMNGWFQWKTLDATDNILVLLGNLVRSHITTLAGCVCPSKVMRRARQT